MTKKVAVRHLPNLLADELRILVAAWSKQSIWVPGKIKREVRGFLLMAF